MAKKKASKPSPLKSDPAVSAFYEAFRERLCRLREQEGLTQEQLCELIDIPVSSYKHMEGKRASKFPLHKISRLSLALRHSCDYILTGREPRSAESQDRRAA